MSAALLSSLNHALVYGDVFISKLFKRFDRNDDGKLTPLDFVISVKRSKDGNRLAACAMATYACLDEDHVGFLTLETFAKGIRKYGRASGHDDVKALLWFWRTTEEEWYEA